MNKKNHGFVTKGQIRRKKILDAIFFGFLILTTIVISGFFSIWFLAYVWSITWGKVI